MSAIRRLVSIGTVCASTWVFAAACGGDTKDPDATDQQSVTGGRSTTGGSDATGGRTMSGGRDGTGGSDATGGRTMSGGRDGTGGSDATGGRPTSGGRDGTGGVVGGGSGGDTAGAPGEAGSGNLDPICRLPVAPGTCAAVIRAYYFDATSGECRPFAYGGCGGNENRFGTMADCVSACGGDTRCESSSQCVAIRAPACCEACEPVTADAFVAVHRDDASKLAPAGCDVACGACPDPAQIIPTSGNFFAECVEGQCLLRDVRDTPASECTNDDDCQLRGGTGCCDDCGDLPVAISDEQALLGRLQCPELACPPCEPSFPDHDARCAAGRCVVAQR